MKITGPESVVDGVKKAVVEANVSDLTDSINITEKISLLDEDGKEVTDSRISRSVNTAKVSITILATKEIPVALSTTGEPQPDMWLQERSIVRLLWLRLRPGAAHSQM